MNQWPTTREFQLFASRVADACTVAMASWVTIGVSNNDFSPLGCLPGVVRKHPTAGYVSHYTGLDVYSCIQFNVGFYGTISSEKEDPYYLLGVAYRKKFVDCI